VVPPGVTHVAVSDARPLANETAVLEMYAEIDAEVEFDLASRGDSPSAMLSHSLTVQTHLRWASTSRLHSIVRNAPSS
jgi:hypothetical protein